MNTHKIIQGDCVSAMKTMPDGCVQTCVTSPPYWGLRDYGHKDQLGAEKTPEAYVENMVTVFREVRRILRDDGTVWLNLGDSYNAGRDGGHPGGKKQWKPCQEKYASRSGANAPGLKPKDLIGIPWRVAFALQADGWYLRQDIIWNKPNPMPESVTDRCTKAHEYIFMLSKHSHYYYDYEAIQERSVSFNPKLSEKKGMKNIFGNMSERGVTRTTEGLNLKSQSEKTKELRHKRSVWTVNTRGYKGAHFAVYPKELIVPCILAGCPVGGTVLDPFTGSGTTAVVALENGRNFIGTELNPEYIKIAEDRIKEEIPTTLTSVME